MNLRFLDTFLVIARLGSFRSAATELGLTQAAISGRVAALEADLGQSLFERTSRESRLTPAGQMVLHYAKHLLNTESALREAVTEHTQQQAAVVRLGIKGQFASTWLADLLIFLTDLQPQIQVSVQTGSTQYLQQLLISDALDLVISAAPLTRQVGIRNQKVADLEVGWFSLPPAQLPLAISLAELARKNPMVCASVGSPLSLTLHDLLKKEGVNACRIHGTEALDTLMLFLRRGCTAYVPKYWVMNALHQQEIVQLPCMTDAPTLPVTINWRNDAADQAVNAIRLGVAVFIKAAIAE